MNKVKIIASVGPSSKDKEILKQLILNGADVIRINRSHASYEFCDDIIKKVREIDKETGRYTGIMLDTTGPNVRIGKFIGGSANLQTGDKIRIYMDEIMGDNTKFSVNFAGLISDVKENAILKLNEGRIELQVLEKGIDYLICEVITGGLIFDNKSLNAPGTKLSIPFLRTNDVNDIVYSHERDVDFLALSFVKSVDDVLEVNDKLIELGNDHLEIISKIENEEAIENLDEIIKSSDGIMVARGDLSVELPMERIPGIQKQIINKCHMHGKVSIVATEMMSSMELVNRPTKAEVSDIANAVLDGADAVMLSGETTIGKYPIETVEIMEKIIKSAEKDLDYMDFLDKAVRTENHDITGMIAYSVAMSANRLRCRAIITPTISGYTARKLSRFKPSAIIIAACPNKLTLRSMSLRFGVLGVYIDELNSFEDIIKKSQIIAYKLINAHPGDKVIITGGYPFKNKKHTNFMKIEEL